MLPSSDLYPTLKPQDSLLKAGKLMDVHQSPLLAVVEKGSFKGIVTRTILAAHYPEEKISSLIDSLPKEAVWLDDDGLVAMPFFEKYHSPIFPIIDEEEKFRGYYTMELLAEELLRTKYNAEDGGILKVQFNPQTDAMSGIIAILEEYKALVVKSFLIDRQEEGQLPLLILQIKTQQLQVLVQHLERHGYFVEQAYRLVGGEEIDQSRYDLLMKYLNI